MKNVAKTRFIQKRCFIAALIPLFLLSQPAGASSMKIVDIDGERYAVSVENRNNARIECGYIKTTIHTTIKDNGTSSHMVTLISRSGENVEGFRIFDAFQNYHNEDYEPYSVSAGCLSERGGIGLQFKAKNETRKDLYLQIDAKARVFSGFNDAGLYIESDPQ